MIFWMVALFAAGIALIFAEFFVPGLILGITGMVCLVASATLAIIHIPDFAGYFILFEVIGLIATIGLGMVALPRSPIGKRMILHTSQDAERGWISTETDTSLVGVVAEVVTPLRPAGTIVANHQRLGAVTEGEFIDAGMKVRIREVQGNRVVVERVESE